MHFIEAIIMQDAARLRSTKLVRSRFVDELGGEISLLRLRK